LLGTPAGALLTRDGGATFTTFSTTSSPALPNNDVRAVAFFDGDTTGGRFLIGTPGGVMWTQDGGASFARFDATNTPNFDPYRLVDVDYFKGDATGKTWLIAGRYDNNSPRGGVWITTSGGAGFTHWHGGSSVALPGNQVTSAAFYQGGTSPTTWMATFDTQWSGAGGLALTTNGGNSFTVLDTTTTPALPSNDCVDCAFGPTAGHWIAGTAAAGIVVTSGGPTNLMPLTTSTTPMLLSDAIRSVAWHGARQSDFAVATAAGLQRTTDGGFTLPAQPLAAPGVLPGSSVADVAIYSGDGSGKRLLVATNAGAGLTTDGGLSWTWFSTTTTPALPSDTVTSVAWYEGNTTGSHFAIGTNGGAVRTTDGGQTFTTYTTANGLPNNGVADVAYFSGAGSNATTLLFATWGGVASTVDGTSFQTLTTATTPALPHAWSSCVSYYEGDTTGKTWLIGTWAGLVRTTDAGASTGNWTVWTQTSTPPLPGQYITSCDFFDGGTSATAFAVTCTQISTLPNSRPTPYGMAFTTDGGQSFTARSYNSGLPTNLVAGVNYHSGMTSPSHLAVGLFGGAGIQGLARTTDGGATFSVLDAGTAPALPTGVWRTDYDDSVAGGGRLVLGLNPYGPFGHSGVLVLDGATRAGSGTVVLDSVEGQLWSTAGGTPTVDDRFARGVAFFDGDTTGSRLAVGGRYGLGLSTDGGTTFTPFNPATSPALATAEIRDVDYFSGDTTGKTVLIATDQGAFLTTDGGTTFTKFDASNGLLANDAVDVCFHQGQSSPQRFAVVTGWSVVITTNGGSSFTALPPGAVYGVPRQIDFFDGDTSGARFCVVTSYHPFHTENGGASFTARGNALAAGYPTCVEYFEGDTTGATWLVGTWDGTSLVGSGGAGLTTDNGATWTVWHTASSPAIGSSFVNAVAFHHGSTSPTHFALGLESGQVAVTTNGGTAFTHYDAAAGLPGGPVRAVTYAQAFGAGARWMVAADEGIALTTDGGTSFSRVGAGAPNWYDRVNLSATLPAGTAVTVQVCDAMGRLLPDAVLAGNSTGLTPDGAGDVRLWGVPVATYPSLRLHVRLSTTAPAAGTTPTLHEARIHFRR
jgi:hypothetical protein